MSFQVAGGGSGWQVAELDLRVSGLGLSGTWYGLSGTGTGAGAGLHLHLKT